MWVVNLVVPQDVDLIYELVTTTALQIARHIASRLGRYVGEFAETAQTTGQENSAFRSRVP